MWNCGVRTDIVPAQEAFHADTRITSHPPIGGSRLRRLALKARNWLSFKVSDCMTRSPEAILRMVSPGIVYVVPVAVARV